MARSKIGEYKMPIAIVVGVIAVVAAVEISLTGCCATDGVKHVLTSGVMSVAEKQGKYPLAPELAGISGYINAPSNLTIAGLTKERKVVIVDFWTYSCINCQRTIPYMNAWYQKYHDQGLEIIGVHSPEFDFEKDHANVLDAVMRFGIKYPVVQDNDYGTWQAYQNQYWPNKFIIDADGFVRYNHIGEGGYDETEKEIQALLQERDDELGLPYNATDNMTVPADAVSVDPSGIGTPEIYLGSATLRQPIGNPGGISANGAHDYALPQNASWSDNLAYLGGRWYDDADGIISNGTTAAIGLKYSARSVNIVAGGSGDVTVLLDGRPVGPSGGADVSSGAARIDGSRLYNVVDGQGYGTHYLELLFTPGVKMYTFTFG